MSDKVKRYTSDDIDVTFNPKRCIHAAECVRGLPAVFDSEKRPWIQPEAGDADAIAAVVSRCPSGALHVERKDGGEAERPFTRNQIAPVVNGPLYVRGDVQLVNKDGELMTQDVRLALCRCGFSENKPFCDNSHKETEFKAHANVADNRATGSTPDAQSPLTVMPSVDGPFVLKGAFEIVSADGQAIFQGTSCALCRCGGSMNKPFCDGTHAKIGFGSDEYGD